MEASTGTTGVEELIASLERLFGPDVRVLGVFKAMAAAVTLAAETRMYQRAYYSLRLPMSDPRKRESLVRSKVKESELDAALRAVFQVIEGWGPGE